MSSTRWPRPTSPSGQQAGCRRERATIRSRGPDPCHRQQWDTGEVLMLAWMDAEALRRTRETGRATYWSRSRGEYWVKGETSGNPQWVRDVRIDCDGDALLLIVEQEGVACHTGQRTCFTETIPDKST
ncbi:MAG: phosphoribosyl-AMP cyclohydrolase [Actinomycetota bacterium]